MGRASARHGTPKRVSRSGRRARRARDVAAQIEAARRGLGVAVVQEVVGDALGLQRLLGGAVVHRSELWLVAHPDVRRSARVRRVWDALTAFLSEIGSRDAR
jgi:DNA-binding transcriptional LysR family regulator